MFLDSLSGKSDFVIFIIFVLSNEIKNQSPIHPVENYPLSNEKKINQIKPFYNALESFPLSVF